MNKDGFILANSRRLKEIKRCNNFIVNKTNDVAQHSFYVALLTTVIANEYNEYVELKSKEIYEPGECELKFVDVGIATQKALFHDFDEAITSDIPWNIKHSGDKEQLRVLKQLLNSKVEKAYENSKSLKSYLDRLGDCKDGLEGEFVSIIDMMELAWYCFEEYNMGNKYIEKLLIKCICLVKEKPIYQTLLKSSETFVNIFGLIRNYKHHNTKGFNTATDCYIID